MGLTLIYEGGPLDDTEQVVEEDDWAIVRDEEGNRTSKTIRDFDLYVMSHTDDVIGTYLWTERVG